VAVGVSAHPRGSWGSRCDQGCCSGCVGGWPCGLLLCVLHLLQQVWLGPQWVAVHTAQLQ
jgi:hypothetical protein